MGVGRGVVFDLGIEDNVDSKYEINMATSVAMATVRSG